MIKGARPILSKKIQNHYTEFCYKSVSLNRYQMVWRHWLSSSTSKILQGLDGFVHADFTNGTSQTFDHFWLRQHDRRKVCFAGEFQYHSCLGKYHHFTVIDDYQDLQAGDALTLSLPFSDLGIVYPEMTNILDRCQSLDIPVCLDLAYWGIAKNVVINLSEHACIKEITCSLSKPFFVLENHRVGIRFSRNYLDDGLSMINEVNMQNLYSMSLGVYFMDRFSCDWSWEEFGSRYHEICRSHDLNPTDTVIFGLGDVVRHREFNRGRPDTFRVCVSPMLQDL